LPEKNQRIYLETLIIMANGNFSTMQERSSWAEYSYDASAGGLVYVRHSTDHLQFASNAIAYRFYLSTPYLSGGLRNWPRQRRGGVAAASRHSPYFSAITHQELSQAEFTAEMRRFREKVLPQLLANAAKNRK
jgi:hypothetical protein